MKSAPCTGIILTQYVPRNVVHFRFGKQPSRYGKVLLSESESVVSRNHQPRCPTVESGDSWDTFRWTRGRKVDCTCRSVKLIAGNVVPVGHERPVRDEVLLRKRCCRWCGHSKADNQKLRPVRHSVFHYEGLIKMAVEGAFLTCPEWAIPWTVASNARHFSIERCHSKPNMVILRVRQSDLPGDASINAVSVSVPMV